MSITTNDLLSLSKNNYSEKVLNKNLKEDEEINTLVSLFLLKRIFISFKKSTINL